MLLTLLPLLARGQADFQPGYVVTVAGDTLRGAVAYGPARAQGAVCLFRPAPGAPEQALGPAELAAYAVAGRHYHVLRVPQPVFAEEVVAGPLPLYFRVDSAGAEHFYLPPPAGQGVAEELRRPAQTLVRAGQRLTRYDDAFRRQLVARMEALGPTCAPTEAQMQGWHLDYMALRRVLADYAACRQQPVALPPLTRFDFTLLAGASALRYSSNTDVPLRTSVAATVAADVQLTPLRLAPHSAIVLLTWFDLPRTFRAQYPVLARVNGLDRPLLLNLRERLVVAATTLGARQFFAHSPRRRAFADVGVGVLLLSGLNRQTLLNFSGQPVDATQMYHLDTFAPVLTVGAGVETRRLRLALRGTVLTSGFEFGFPGLQVLVGVRFPSR